MCMRNVGRGGHEALVACGQNMGMASVYDFNIVGKMAMFWLYIAIEVERVLCKMIIEVSCVPHIGRDSCALLYCGYTLPHIYSHSLSWVMVHGYGYTGHLSPLISEEVIKAIFTLSFLAKGKSVGVGFFWQR